MPGYRLLGYSLGPDHSFGPYIGTLPETRARKCIEMYNRLVGAIRERRLAGGLWRRVKHPIRETRLRWALGVDQSRSTTLPRISLRDDFSGLSESELLKQALHDALNNISSLPDSVRQIDGMSGQKYRAFISSLIKNHRDPRYLEIGSWTGSTATSAIWGNKISAVCIDNWSEFGGPRSTFFSNIERVLAPTVEFKFIDANFRQVDYSSIGCFNVYLFDGPHAEQDQYDGIMIARPALANPVILIVDDWNWREVRLGTFRALRDAKLCIASSIEIRTTMDGTLPSVCGRNSDWHNGYFIATLLANSRVT